jgi:hypothetical protein
MYLTFLLSALETALGSDFGLGQAEGLPNWGSSACTRSARAGRQLNYADAIEELQAAPQCVDGGRYDRARVRRRTSMAGLRARTWPPNVFHLLWSARPPRAPPRSATSARFRKHRVAGASQRLAHNSGSWVALKGGSNAATLGHLDLGQLHHRRAGAAVGRRSGARTISISRNILARSGGRYFRLRTESHKHAARRWAEPGRETATAPIVGFATTRIGPSPSRTWTAAVISPGAYPSTRGVAPDRRARRADSV